MMNKFLKFLLINTCLLGSTQDLLAQLTYENWLFGNGVGLNFSTSPPTVLSNANLTFIEGNSTISDNNGKLVFYTNGVRIHNRNYSLMKNGDNILGDLSSTCNAVIVQLPGSDSLYYVFTVGAAGKVTQGFRYNIVDMTNDGGLGEVTSKNQVIDVEIYEKLAAVRHCNKKDVWLVVRKWETDEYHAYLLTQNGITGAPVISHTGLNIGGFYNNALGSLKFSSDGKKLAAAHSFETDAVELMNFNDATGVLSSPVVFKPHNIPFYSGVYGLEFSPNGKLLYVSSSNNNTELSKLYQFDITTQDPTSIIASKQVIAQNNAYVAGGLQLAPDQKIYYCLWKNTAVSVIENPDNYGVSCNFQSNKIYMGGSANSPTLQFCFPTCIASDLVPANAPYDFKYNIDCNTKNVTFSLTNLNLVDSVKWDFGDGATSKLINPVHTYGTNGLFNVVLTVYNSNTCLPVARLVKHEVIIGSKSNNILPGDTAVCKGENLNIAPLVSGTTYLWSTNATTSSISVNATGQYWLESTINGCLARDTINIDFKTVPSVYLGKDTSVCNESILLTAPAFPGYQYLWNTGDTTRSIAINKPGTYSVNVKNNACSSSDTIKINPGNCPMFIPSAFTPNGDGRNDKFGVNGGFYSVYFVMQVYNRYGQPIFQTSDPSEKWDGTFKGDPQPGGGYIWQIKYKNSQGFFENARGMVMLIR